MQGSQAESSARAIKEEDKSSLQKLLGEATTTALIALYERINSAGAQRLESQENSVKLPPMEREDRGQVHRVGNFCSCFYTRKPADLASGNPPHI